jgi:hypothetical protein
MAERKRRFISRVSHGLENLIVYWADFREVSG